MGNFIPSSYVDLYFLCRICSKECGSRAYSPINRLEKIKLKDLFITVLPFVVCAIYSSQNKFPFRSEDWHFVPSISPFLIDPLGKSCSLCLFIKFDIWICCLSMRSLSFPPPFWSLSDSNMYMMSPLPDACNSYGGIILYGPWILSDSGRLFSVSAFLISYMEIEPKYSIPVSSSSRFLFLEKLISSMVR